MPNTNSNLYSLFQIYNYLKIKSESSHVIKVEGLIRYIVSQMLFSNEEINLKNTNEYVSEVLDNFVNLDKYRYIEFNQQDELIIVNFENENVQNIFKQFDLIERYIQSEYNNKMCSEKIQKDLILSICKLEIDDDNKDEGRKVSLDEESDEEMEVASPTQMLEYLKLKKKYQELIHKKMQDDYEESEESEESEEDDRIVEVTSSNGEDKYYVNIDRWTCSCPSYQFSLYAEPTCKHLYQVYDKIKNGENVKIHKV